MAHSSKALLMFSERPPHVGMWRARKTMIRNVCCVLLVLGWFGQAAAQQSDPRESKLVVLEHLWNEAQVNHDSPSLAALVAERFINTEYNATLTYKTKFLSHINPPL